MFSKEQKEQHLHGAGDAYMLSQKVSELFQKEYCVLLNSATSAIETLCDVLGIKGKLIYTSNYNWPGALMPFLKNDNEIIVGRANRNFSIDLDDLKHYTPDVVLVVDFHGIAHSDQKEIADYCKSISAFLITDASCSMGTKNSDGFSTGYYSDLVVTSFGPQKSFYAGEGGAILTNYLSVFESCILHTEHPYRHIAEGLERNFFSINRRMNPFGISHLLENFENNLKILTQQQVFGFQKYIDLKNKLSDDSPIYTPSNSVFEFLLCKTDWQLSEEDFSKIKINSLFNFHLPNNLKAKRVEFTDECLDDVFREFYLFENKSI